MHIDLYIFITNVVTDLQQKSIGIHTRNSSYSTTNAENYKDKVFPYCEFLHSNIKDEAQSTTCIPIKPNNIIHMDFDLVFLMDV